MFGGPRQSPGSPHEGRSDSRKGSDNRDPKFDFQAPTHGLLSEPCRGRDSEAQSTHQNGPISWMRVKCINQIPDGKEREPENCTSQVEIVTRAPFEPPVHPRKQLKRFRDVRKGDDHKARRAEELEKSRDGLSSSNDEERPTEHHGGRHDRNQRSDQGTRFHGGFPRYSRWSVARARQTAVTDSHGPSVAQGANERQLARSPPGPARVSGYTGHLWFLLTFLASTQ